MAGQGGEGGFTATEESAATGCGGQSGEIPAQRSGADQLSPAWEACLLTCRDGWGLGAEARASEVGSQGEDWGWRREHSLKGASVPRLARRESGKKSGPAQEAREYCSGVREERGFRAPPKRAPETGASRSYQCRHQRRAWNTKASAAATKKPVWKHRSLSTPPLLGACAARHCQCPVIQRQLPRENTWRTSGWCNVTPASAAAGSLRTPYPSLPPAWVSESRLTRCSFNAVLCEREQTLSRDLRAEAGPNPKLTPRELCEQRRERKIFPSSLRSSGLNLHNQLDVPASVEYLNRQRIIPNWGGGLWEQRYTYFFPFSLFVCMCMLLCVILSV